MKYVLQAKHLTKNHHNYNVINDLNINIPQNSIYALIGRRNSGKSTLIKLISGLLMPSSGAYTLFGTSHLDKKISKTRKKIGVMFESPSFYPNMSAEDNIKMQYLNYGIPDYLHIRDLLDFVGLDTYNKKVKEFSLEMRCRLGIALAISSHPDFLLLDEPFTGLDSQGIIDIRELIFKLNKEKNITVLVSSNNLNEINKIATHYGFIDRGSIVKELSAEELENSCKKYIRISVNNIFNLIKILDQMHLSYKLINEDTADIYGKINITKLITNLASEKCEVTHITEHDEELDNYFLKIIEGETTTWPNCLH